jgi:hypothetical protein
MRSKVTVVLLFLNVVLFAYIYFYDKPRIEKLQTLESVRRVFGPEAATITSFTRTSRTGEKVKLEKKIDSWWLTAPYEWPASPNATSSLLNAIELLEHDTSFPVADLAKGGRSLADYGLADPALSFQFTSGERTYDVQIGDVTAVGNRLYLLSPDKSRIHVVNRSFAEAIGVPLDVLRAPSIFSVPVFEVRSLNVETARTEGGSNARPASLKVRLRRDAASRWVFEAPINARASKTAVEVTITAVANVLTARSFLEPRDTDLERAGLNAPSLQVTLEGNARRETLLLGNTTGVTVPREGAKEPDVEYFAKIEDKPVVFTTAVPADLLKVLRTAQESLRDPRVLDFDPSGVTSVTLVAPGQPELTLQKLEGDNQGWQAVLRVSGAAPQTTAADPEVVSTLLKKIAQLSAHEPRPNAPKFLSDAPSASDLENWGFNRPAREITLNLAPGAGGGPTREPTSLTLQIGVSPDKPGEAFARATNAPYVYQVLPDILDDTPVAARHYRNRILRELPEAARITSLKLTALPANTAVVSLSNATAITPESLATATFTPGDAAPAGGTTVATPIPEKARTVLVSLLAQLRTLRAKAFTAGTFVPDHAETATGPQPWKYQLEVVTSFAAGTAPAQNTTLTLLLTDRLGGTTMLAGTAEFGGVVFEVTQEMLDAIFALTYGTQQDPGLPAATPEKPPAVEPTPPAKTETPPPAKP